MCEPMIVTPCNRIWNENYDLILLEQLAVKQYNLRAPIELKVYKEIVEEHLPNFTPKQCKMRLSKMQMGFKNRKNQLKTVRVNLTSKVYAKIEEMWPNGFISRRTAASPAPVTSQSRLKPQNTELREGGRRIWNEHFDELLLDGLIRKKLTSQYCIRQTCFEEIVQESLPNFTADQCRYRLQVLRKTYKRKPDATEWSKKVYEKLQLIETTRPAYEGPKIFVRIWDEENDLRLLNALTVLHFDFKKPIPPVLWNIIAEEAMPDKITAEQCQSRSLKLRQVYQKRKVQGKLSKVKIPEKVLAKLGEMYDEDSESRRPRELDICRCCGQIDGNFIDLNKDTDTLNWFLAFTGLTIEQLVRPYTKICHICSDKLGQAGKFRELCLMGAQVIKTELENAPQIQKPDTQLDVENAPPVAKEKAPKCCAVCGEMVAWVKFKSHMRPHYIQRLEKKIKCGTCGQTYRTLAQLRRHAQYHADGEIHECTKCPRKFRCKGDLRRHARSHNQKLMAGHLCTICGKVCESSRDLHFHINSHSGIKPYKCPHCDQRFARVHGMNNHIRGRHENIRHPCNYCGQKYMQKTKLKMHTLLVHQGAYLRCDSCSLKSITLKSFKLHLRDVHQKTFNQTIHVILRSGEKLLRRRQKLDDSLIQTEIMDLDGDLVPKEEDLEEEFVDEEIVLDEMEIGL